MKYVKTPVFPKKTGTASILAHAIPAAILLIAGVCLPDILPEAVPDWIVFVLCVLAAFALVIHLIVRLSWNRLIFDPADPAYEQEWLIVTEEGIEFKEKVTGKGFRYDTGRLLWEDMAWIRINYLNTKSGKRASAVFIDAKSADRRSPGSFLKSEGVPDRQTINMTGYDEQAAADIEKYATGKVRFDFG